LHERQDEEPEIPGSLVSALADVVYPEHQVIDRPLDQIEGAPTHQKQAHVASPRRSQLSSPPRPNEQRGRHEYTDPGGEMKEAVAELGARFLPAVSGSRRPCSN
jgi:hypothetical protein